MSVAYLLSSGAVKPPPVVIPRPPLPLPLPNPVRDGDPFSQSLPWEPPAIPNVDYYRGDAWGVEMPDAPLVPGMNPATKDRILSWFIDRYPLDFQKAYLTKYAGFGYTHITLSPPDSIEGYGQTLEQFVETVKLCKQYVPYVCCNMMSKDYPPFGVGRYQLTFDQFVAYNAPRLEALLPLVSEVVPGWEWDLYFPSSPVAIQMISWMGNQAHAAGVKCYLHFSSGVTSWQANGQDRFTFWDQLGTSVDGLNYQTNPAWTSREVQDRLVDTLWFFGQRGNIWHLRCWEDYATYLYNYPSVTPDDANARQWYACCTYDDVRGTDAKVWGFGNGGRRPDGSRL